MTKEERLELIKKLDTQIDGVEAYIRQLNEANEDNDDAWFLRSAECRLDELRTFIGRYENRKLKQARRD